MHKLTGTILVIATALLSSTLWGQSTYQVNRSDGTLPSPGPTPQLDLNSLPPAVRAQLLPLYQQEYTLLQDLKGVRFAALSEVLMGLSPTFAGALVSTQAANAVEGSAASAGVYGARQPGLNAALDAQDSPDLSAVDRGRDLLTKIGALEDQISYIQRINGLNPAIRSQWSALFPRYTPEQVRSFLPLTPAELKKLLILAPAAKEAGKPVANAGKLPTCGEGVRRPCVLHIHIPPPCGSGTWSDPCVLDPKCKCDEDIVMKPF